MKSKKISPKYITISILFSIAIICGLANLSTAGELKQIIISPFNMQVAGEAKEFYSGITEEPIYTTVSNKYRNFNEYSNEADTPEPFCQIGGQYTINVTNDASTVKDSSGPDPIKYAKTFNLFYCYTIADIINSIRIPSSWQNDDIILYCNDGSDISTEYTNFDYMTSRINTYKSCVVKNLDIKNNNTIIYGFEVGNKEIDSDTEYFYDQTTHKGRMLNDLTYIKKLSSSSNTVQEILTAQIPFTEKKQNFTYSFNVGSGINSYKTNWSAATETEALKYLQKNINPNINNIRKIRDVLIEDLITFKNSYTIYEYTSPVNYKIEKYLYSDSQGRNYYFTYNPEKKFYTLSNFNKNLNLDINTIFPETSQIGISRVALFKKIADKTIYGYEAFAQSQSTDQTYKTSQKSIYKIKLKNFAYFTQDDCTKTLASYERKLHTIEFDTQISCKSNTISIVSNNLNTEEEKGKAFHLFKNIVMNLALKQ